MSSTEDVTETPDTNAEGALRFSLVISAIRCTITYVVLPIVAPLVGWASGVGPLVGLPIAAVALVANVVSIRRYHAHNHRWKWPVSALNAGIFVLVTVLVVFDLRELLG